MVAPFTGAWIEIVQYPLSYGEDRVAPFTGAWIEIWSCRHIEGHWGVAPFTGAWIEIGCASEPGQAGGSLPLRERGLKCESRGTLRESGQVAPFTGAWIEMLKDWP